MADPRPGFRRYAVALPLEGIAGSFVQDVAADMLSIANRLQIPVTLDMNGAHLFVMPGGVLADIRADHERQIHG